MGAGLTGPAVAGSDEAVPQTAGSLGKQQGMYELVSPPADVAPNAIDELWKHYEPELPDAILRFAKGTNTPKDWGPLLIHLICMSSRLPGFELLAEQFLKAQGAASVTRDDIQWERVRTINETLPLLAACRFRIIFRATDGPRFFMNDKGFTNVGVAGTRDKGTLFPLSGDVALLMVPDVGVNAANPGVGLARGWTFTPATVEMFNLAAWKQVGSGFLVGHPDDKAEMERLSSAQDLTLPRLGAFRGRGVEGPFEWAFRE